MGEGGYPKGQIRHIYNFADTSKFIPELSKESYYVYLGRLSKEKGVETLLKAASEHSNFKLKVIGDGHLRTNLEERYSSANIEFIGYRKWDEIKQILGKARFMVLPSECYENNPLSIIESFALGTPVLGASIGGIPELVNSTNGMLFRAGDSEDLSNKIDEMMAIDSWDYQKISDDASIKFSAESYYNKLMKIYKGE